MFFCVVQKNRLRALGPYWEKTIWRKHFFFGLKIVLNRTNCLTLLQFLFKSPETVFLRVNRGFSNANFPILRTKNYLAQINSMKQTVKSGEILRGNFPLSWRGANAINWGNANAHFHANANASNARRLLILHPTTKPSQARCEGHVRNLSGPPSPGVDCGRPVAWVFPRWEGVFVSHPPEIVGI